MSDVRGGARKGSPGDDLSPPPSMQDLDALYSRLAGADEAGDATALATLAWELYGLLGLVEADLHALRARVHELLTR